MKSMSEIAVDSARQNAAGFVEKKLFDCSIKKSLWYAIFFLLVVALSSCHDKTNGQDVAGKSPVKPENSLHAKTPKVTVKVNRHFDEKGNLVGFDSTYSSFYESGMNDTTSMDSLFRNFDGYFNEAGKTSVMNQRFNSLFFQDSLIRNDFFHDDFFQKRYELNDAYMRMMMVQMDSLKNHFYEERSKTKGKKPAGK